MTTIPVTNDLSSREDSNTCIMIPIFTIWAQIHTVTRITQSIQLWIKTSWMGQGCLYIDLVYSQMMIVIFSFSRHIKRIGTETLAMSLLKGHCLHKGYVQMPVHEVHKWIYQLHIWVANKFQSNVHFKSVAMDSLVLEETSLVLMLS